MLTENQVKTLSIAPKFSASLSILGSSWIIYEILSQREKLKQAYQRLMLAMSVGDVCLSFASFFLTTWPIPKGQPGVFYNIGNQTTCEIQGFIGQIGSCYTLYNAYLALYFVLVVRYNWKEESIRFLEYFLHIVTFAFALGSSVTCLVMGMFNNYFGLACWIAEYPLGCIDNPDVECERGHNAIFYQYVFYFIWIWGALIAIVLMMLLLYWTVLQQSKGMERYAHGGSDKNKKRVAEQAFLYIGAYLVMSFFPTLQVVVRQVTGGKGYFPIYLGNGIFFPMQGCFNFFIYLRPRYLRNRKKKPNASRLQVIREMQFGETNERSGRRGSATQMRFSSSTHKSNHLQMSIPHDRGVKESGLSSGFFSSEEEITDFHSSTFSTTKGRSGTEASLSSPLHSSLPQQISALSIPEAGPLGLDEEERIEMDSSKADLMLKALSKNGELAPSMETSQPPEAAPTLQIFDDETSHGEEDGSISEYFL